MVITHYKAFELLPQHKLVVFSAPERAYAHVQNLAPMQAHCQC